MKLFSTKLEMSVLRTLLTIDNQHTISKIMTSINAECFGSDLGQLSFRRIKILFGKDGQLPSWVELRNDPTLSEEIRIRIEGIKCSIIPKDKITSALSQLNRWRQIRNINRLTHSLIDSFNNEKVDIDQIENDMRDTLLKNHITETPDEWFIHVGGKNLKTSLDMIKKALSVPKDFYIPTGFKGFDTLRRGVPRGSLMIIGAPTGGGKSVMAQQLAENMSLWGAKCAFVPLEMSEMEMYQRHISRYNNLSMNQVISPHKLSLERKRKIYQRHIKFIRELQSKGGLLSYFTPKKDIDFEETLMILKPYNYDVILIDYVGLLKGVDGDRQWQVMREITRVGKRHALMTNSIVILCAQLDQEGLLRYSRGMQEDASLMMKWKMDDVARQTGIIKVELPKSRNQSSNFFPLKIEWEFMRVRDINEEDLKIAEQTTQDNQNNQDKKRTEKGSGRKHYRVPQDEATADDDYFRV